MPPDSADQDRARLIVVEARSYGIQMFEQSGCYTARDRWLRVPQYIVDHHDASTLASGEWGSLGYILRERISNFQVARGLDGVPKAALVAAGANCPHAGLGGPWGTCPRDSMNGWGYGVEKAGTTGERYTPAALYATQGLYHAIEVVCGRPPGSMVVEHAEWGNLGHANRKNDSDYGKGGTPNGGPGGNGNWMRQQVRDFGASQPTPAPPALPTPKGTDAMLIFYQYADSRKATHAFGAANACLLSGGVQVWIDPRTAKREIEEAVLKLGTPAMWAVEARTWQEIAEQAATLRGEPVASQDGRDKARTAQ